MNLFQTIKKPPWRTIVPGCILLLAIVAFYHLWTPGLDVQDGRNDRKRNGIWIGHQWFAADSWFKENGKSSQIHSYRDPQGIQNLAALLKSNHITDVFPHLCPVDAFGNLPESDPRQIERFLDAFEGLRVMPWIGGPGPVQARVDDEKWRLKFISSVTNLITEHPRLAGIHINIEPMPSGDNGFLRLEEELRAALPKGKIISIAAYPPPIFFQRDNDIHWTEDYFRQVSERSDQMAVMMYDTGLQKPKLYQYLMSRWTREILDWSGNAEVLLGLPAYEDKGVDYHNPNVENLGNALMGIHSGLAHSSSLSNYQGVAIYSEWEMNEEKWQYFENHFLTK
ncbi:MAG TPA: hypothetical protein VMH87_10225 [Pseudomonadales bacterium]|nr:hypothetical protein [Pseudomonadales bacterium]